MLSRAKTHFENTDLVFVKNILEWPSESVLRTSLSEFTKIVRKSTPWAFVEERMRTFLTFSSGIREGIER